MNQTMQIYEYMKTHGSITQRDAVREFECYRLAARIADLKADGVRIVGDMEVNERTGKRFKRYWLEPEVTA